MMSKKSASAVLTALSLFLSCQREELVPQYDSPDGLVFTFSSESASVVKTEWDGSTIQWSAGDKIAVGYTLNDVWSDKLFESESLAAAASKARFSVQTDLVGSESGEMDFYGVYPSSAFSSDLMDAPVVKFNVPAVQTLTGDTFDSSADIMVAKSFGKYSKVQKDNVIPLMWTRLVSHADITLTNIALSEGESLVSVVLTADENASMTGEFSVDLTTGEFEKTSSAYSNTLSLDVSALSVDEAGNLRVWAAFMPCRWESLKVELTTSEKKYIRSISVNSLELLPNRRNTLEVDMSSAFGEDVNIEVFELLNLDYPGLEQVKTYYLAEDYHSAANALVEYYRTRPIVNPEEVLSERRMYNEDKRIAQQALEHRFCVRRGYWYESVSGTEYTYYDFDDENGKINWYFELPGAGQENYQMHWHQWFKYLAWAQYLTGDDKYFNNWKEGALASLGYVGGYESSTKDEITAITTMDGFAEFVKENDKIQLTAGYYFLKGTGVGNNANWYITYGDNGTDFVAKALADGQKLGAKHVWSFDEIENENGYKLKSANLDKYATTAAAGATSQVTSNYNSGYKFVFTDNGAGKFTIKDGNGNVLRTENGGQLNHWSDETNETWYVIPAVELDITLGAEYGTIHLPFDVTLPAGLKAYAVTAVSDTYATLTEKEDIKANEGVILQGQGTHKLTIAAASSDWAENKLDGSNVNTLVESEAYVLSNGDSGLGLYKAKLNFLNGEKVEEGGTAFLNNANKAYLPVVTSGVNALRFNFDGETTAIETVETENANAPIYDLSGRRVVNTVKGGIYIQNGKKFIVK